MRAHGKKVTTNAFILHSKQKYRTVHNDSRAGSRSPTLVTLTGQAVCSFEFQFARVGFLSSIRVAFDRDLLAKHVAQQLVKVLLPLGECRADPLLHPRRQLFGLLDASHRRRDSGEVIR